MKPLSKRMPSVSSSSRPKVLLSSTVMTPSLPTLSIASAMISPTVGSPAEIEAVEAICSLVSTSLEMLASSSATAATAASMPRLRAIGLAPAATLRSPSRTSAWARTVAVVVPSPATSLVLVATSLTSCAPRFSYGSSSSTSRAMVTPSLVMVGAPNFLSMTTLRPLGPIVTLTVSASLLTPRSRARRASSSNFRIFAMELNCSSQKQELRPCRPASYVAGGQGRRTEANVGELLLDDREDVARREDEVLLAVVLHLGAAVLAVQHDIAGLDVERQALAVLEAARTHGQDDAL